MKTDFVDYNDRANPADLLSSCASQSCKTKYLEEFLVYAVSIPSNAQ